MWRKENLERPEPAAFPASPDREVTRVCRVCLVVRVCLDFLVSLSRVKDSRGSLGFLGDLELQASPDQREKQESWVSLDRLEKGGMMAHLVYLATLEDMVVLVAKVNPEILLVIPEFQEVKAC